MQLQQVDPVATQVLQALFQRWSDDPSPGGRDFGRQEDGGRIDPLQRAPKDPLARSLAVAGRRVIVVHAQLMGTANGRNDRIHIGG